MDTNFHLKRTLKTNNLYTILYKKISCLFFIFSQKGKYFILHGAPGN